MEYLVHDVPNVHLGEQPVSGLHQLVEVSLHIFEHEEQLVILTDDLDMISDVHHHLIDNDVSQ